MYQLTKNGVMKNGAHIPNDPNNGQWAEYQEWLSKGNSPEAISLDDRQFDVVRKVKSIRQSRLARPIDHNGKKYHADAKSQSSLVAATVSGDSRHWTDASGDRQMYTMAQLKDLLQAMVDYDQGCYNKSASLLLEIYKSDNPEAIDIKSGWPS